jgi:hypothetical protein
VSEPLTVLIFLGAICCNLLRGSYNLVSHRCMAKIDVDKTYESSIAASMIVMRLSIIAVVIIYITVGHVGPTYSSNIMSLQQRKLRQKYGLPAQPIITNLKILQIPSSIRSVPPSVYYRSSNSIVSEIQTNEFDYIFDRSPMKISMYR